MKSLKLHFSFSIIILINFIFSIKYLQRYTESGIFLAILILIIQTWFIFLFRKKKISKKKFKIFLFVFIFMLVGLVFFAENFIELNSLNVDRWSVIHSFFEEVSLGNYPYFAKSHMNNYPGPMPFYFIIAYPFYKIGLLSLLSAIGYGIICFVFYKNFSQKSFLLYLILISSLFMYWEVLTRSNLFTYSLLVVLTLHLVDRNFNNKPLKKLIILAIITGFSLSTRSIYILAYIIYFLPIVFNSRASLKKLFLFLTIAFISFLSTFLPFIIPYKDEFLKMNPFIIQSSFLIPSFYIILFIIISIVLSFYVKNRLDKLFYSGLSIFIAITIYVIYHSLNGGFITVLVESKIDISYYLFCVPFLLYYILKEPSFKKPFLHTNLK